MIFRVGQKMVCVKDTPWSKLVQGERGPIFRQICTIRRICAGDEPGDKHPSYFMFDEIKNPDIYKDRGYGTEASFGSGHFRPLQERSTEAGMEILRKVAREALKRSELCNSR